MRLDSGSPDIDYVRPRREDTFGQARLLILGPRRHRKGIVSYVPPHQLLQEVERQEREARLRLAEARRQAQAEGPGEHHQLIHKLEAEWKHALDRLHRARHAAQD
jgi:hypothetical protein